jgi:hypothetical protein
LCVCVRFSISYCVSRLSSLLWESSSRASTYFGHCPRRSDPSSQPIKSEIRRLIYLRLLTLPSSIFSLASGDLFCTYHGLLLPHEDNLTTICPLPSPVVTSLRLYQISIDSSLPNRRRRACISAEAITHYYHWVAATKESGHAGRPRQLQSATASSQRHGRQAPPYPHTHTHARSATRIKGFSK